MCKYTIPCPGILISSNRTVIPFRVDNNCYFLVPEEEYRALYNPVPVELNKDGFPLNQLEPERNKFLTVPLQVRECIWREYKPRGDVVRDFEFTSGLKHTFLSKAWMISQPIAIRQPQAKDVLNAGPLVVVQDRRTGNETLLLLPEAEAKQLNEDVCWDAVVASSTGGYWAREDVVTKPGRGLRMRCRDGSFERF